MVVQFYARANFHDCASENNAQFKKGQNGLENNLLIL